MVKRKFVISSEPVQGWWSAVYCPGGWSGHSGFPDDELSSEEGVAKTVYELSECDDDTITLSPCKSGAALPSEPSAGQGSRTDQAGAGIPKWHTCCSWWNDSSTRDINVTVAPCAGDSWRRKPAYYYQGGVWLVFQFLPWRVCLLLAGKWQQIRTYSKMTYMLFTVKWQLNKGYQCYGGTLCRWQLTSKASLLLPRRGLISFSISSVTCLLTSCRRVTANQDLDLMKFHRHHRPEVWLRIIPQEWECFESW